MGFHRNADQYLHPTEVITHSLSKGYKVEIEYRCIPLKFTLQESSIPQLQLYSLFIIKEPTASSICMNKIYSTIILAFTLLFFTNCGSKSNSSEENENATPSDTIAIYYYNLRANGNFDEYIASMHSCLNTTDDYKQRMRRMLQHHYKEIQEEKKGTNRVQVIKTTMHDNNKMANVYLNVVYNDSSHEEIIFPLIYENGKWFIQ